MLDCVRAGDLQHVRQWRYDAAVMQKMQEKGRLVLATPDVTVEEFSDVLLSLDAADRLGDPDVDFVYYADRSKIEMQAKQGPKTVLLAELSLWEATGLLPIWLFLRRQGKQFRVPVLSPGWLTEAAVFLAGRKRGEVRGEWRSHLAGWPGGELRRREQVCAACGFVWAAIRYRFEDAIDLAWRPVDAVLGSRTLSNLFVWGPVIVTLVAIVRHDGRFGLVADDQDPVALGAFLYVAVKTGRWWRQIKLPDPKPRRVNE